VIVNKLVTLVAEVEAVPHSVQLNFNCQIYFPVNI
jgi:hypothetical protein